MSANLQSLTSFDPISIGIDLVGDILGLPPEVKNVAKVAVGVAMMDPFLVINGVAGLAQNAQEVAQTEWSPPRDGSACDGYTPPGCGTGGASPGQGTPAGGTDRSSGPLRVGTGRGLSGEDREYYEAVDALWRDFDKVETAGWLKLRDGILSREDLEAVASDPKVPDHVRQAAGYFLDHPRRLDSLLSYPPIGPPRVDRNRLAAEVREGERRGAYGNDSSNVAWTPGGVGSGSSTVHDIMSNPSLSPMEKIEMLMQAMADQADQEALGIAQDIDQMQAQQRGLDTKSPEGQKKAAELQESIDKKMQRMQKLLQRRTEMMALVTNLNQMQHENAMRCIERMAR